jgi:hypothetical protein
MRPYDLDHKPNLIALPEDAPKEPRSAELPLHRGSHDEYAALVSDVASRVLDDLRLAFPDGIPTEMLAKATGEVERATEKIVRAWTKTQEPMSAAFQLGVNAEHLGDDEEDATLIKFPGWDEPIGLINTIEPKFPAPILFEANLDTLAVIDYLITDSTWPVMSKRMLETLRSVGPFPHRAIPLVMLDDTVKDQLDANGKPRPEAANFDFLAVQITKYTDAFDREQSEYEPSAFLTDRAAFATKLVLKDVPLPPLFRLDGMPGPLMVSAAARAALDRAGIKGVRYIPLEHVT